MNLYARWMALPATVREPIRSFVVSALLGAQQFIFAILGVGYGLGKCGTPHDTLIFFGQVWWGALLGIVVGVGPYYRASQAKARVKCEDPGS